MDIAAGSARDSEEGSDYMIVPSKSTGSDTDPLDFDTKVAAMKEMFPHHSSHISDDSEFRTILDVLKYAHNQGYANARIIAGGKRVKQFDELSQKYNNALYEFGNLETVSSGDRDEDGEGIEAMSATTARQAALDNDLATVATEISKQLGTSADFAKMNRIEQEAMAKAVGMTTDQVGEMLLKKDMEKGLSEGALSDAQKQTLEAMKNREAQEKISQALGKIGQAFAPIVGFIADIVSNSFVLYSLLGVALLTKLGGIKKAVAGIGEGFKTAKSGVKSFLKFADGGMGGMMKKTKEYGKTLSNAFKGGKSSAEKFYKGGQFMPGGGRAPKGGAFAKIKAPKGLDKGASSIAKPSPNPFKKSLIPLP
jgi:hypothetical protein